MNAPNFPSGSNRSGGLPSVRDNSSELAPDAGRGLSAIVGNAADFEDEHSNWRAVFFKYLGLALKHLWMILGFCVTAILIGFVVTYTATPLYRATATIQIDRDVAKVVKVDAPDAAADVGDNRQFYQTQYDLLRSRSLAKGFAGDPVRGKAPISPTQKQFPPWGGFGGWGFPAGFLKGGNFSQPKVPPPPMVKAVLASPR